MNDTTAPAPVSASRRNWLAAGVAIAAAAAGGGFAWWRQRPAGEDAAAVERLWGLTFQTPKGETLAFAGFKGRPLLVNFWATWCPPCVEEMPLLDAFFREHAAKGWQTVGLAIDQPSAVRAFLQRTPIAYPIGLAGLEGSELTRSLGNTAGALPFSVLLGADGTVRQRRIGRVTAGDLKAWSGLA